MTDHYVRHLLRPGDYIKTEFKCTADHGAHCRTSCDRCRSEEQCVCEQNDREPDLQDQGECLLILWLRDDPEETFQRRRGGDTRAGVAANHVNHRAIIGGRMERP